MADTKAVTMTLMIMIHPCQPAMMTQSMMRVLPREQRYSTDGKTEILPVVKLKSYQWTEKPPPRVVV